MSLENKYYFIGTEEFYTYGKILNNLGDNFYLIHKTGCEKPYNCIMHLTQLVDDDNKSCQIFDTEQEFNDYLDWINTSSANTPNVFKLVKDEE